MNVIVAYALLIFGLGVNYIFNILVARFLGPADFGDFSYAIYLFNIFSLVAVFSLDQAAIKFIPQSTNSTEFRIAIQQLSLLLASLFSVLFAFFVYIFIEGSRAYLAYLFVPCIIPFVLLTVNVAILQAEHIVGPRMAFRYVIEPVVKMLGFLLLFYYFRTSATAVIALFLALMLTNLAAIITYRKRLLFNRFGLSRSAISTFAAFVLPMSASNVISVVSARLDLLILGALVASSDLGSYTAAVQTAAILAIVLQGIETVYAPIFSSYMGENNFSLLEKDYRLSLRWAMMISSPLLIIFIIYPEIVMLPFGSVYRESAFLLSILCFGHFFILAMGGTSNTILVLLGKAKAVFFISVVYVIITAISVGISAKYFGVAGAAIGVVFAVAIISVIRVYYAYKASHCQPFDIYYFKIIFAFLLMLLIGYLGKKYLLNAGIVILPVVFYLLLFVLGLHDNDIVKIKNIYKKVLKIL